MLASHFAILPQFLLRVWSDLAARSPLSWSDALRHSCGREVTLTIIQRCIPLPVSVAAAWQSKHPSRGPFI